MDDNKKFWQKFAKLYTPFMKSNKKLYTNICEEISPHLNKTMDVLELACGTGQLSIPLCTKVRLWEATDFSENMIAQAKKNSHSSRLHFSVQDATNLPYADSSFDAVVISNALHIMPRPEIALSEIKRVLKPNGILFAPTFVHNEGVGFRIRTKLLEFIGFRAYFKWNQKEFVDYIENNGFSVTESKILGSNIAPLCCLVAEKTFGICGEMQ